MKHGDKVKGHVLDKMLRFGDFLKNTKTLKSEINTWAAQERKTQPGGCELGTGKFSTLIWRRGGLGDPGPSVYSKQNLVRVGVRYYLSTSSFCSP